MHGDRKYIADIRRDYLKGGLLEKDLRENPVDQFEIWFEEAVAASLVDGNAMSVSTVDEGRPDSRIVLLKSFDDDGFIFFTNYGSHKARQLEKNPNAALLFYWAEFERQIRIDGVISKVSRELSAQYFKTRPRQSQLGAWASRQSEIAKGGREEIEARFSEIEELFGEQEIPVPDFWGGYILKPSYFEFWQGRPNRLHDRLAYRKKDDSWEIVRFFP